MVCFFIKLSLFSPISRADHANDALSERKTNSQDSRAIMPDAIIPILLSGMCAVREDQTLRIFKCHWYRREIHTVLGLVARFLCQFPFKIHKANCTAAFESQHNISIHKRYAAGRKNRLAVLRAKIRRPCFALYEKLVDLVNLEGSLLP